MTSRPDEPPPYLRREIDDAERVAITRAIGPLPPELLMPIRDGRGQAFQRLEFLGDSVLDLALAVHALVEPECPACRAVAGEVGKLVTDHALARQAAASDFGSWLEWQASPDRLADLIEAGVAAAWLSGGWPQAAALVQRVVHPLGQPTVDVLDVGASAADQRSSRKPLRRVGSALFELAASDLVYRATSDADEGELSQRRAQLHRTSRVAEYARQHRLGDGDHAGSNDAVLSDAVLSDAVLSDAVEEMLAGRLLRLGARPALIDAAAVLA